MSNKAERLLDYQLSTHPEPLVELLADNGYEDLAEYDQVKESALDFMSQGEAEAKSVIALHPDYELIVEHYLSGKPAPKKKKKPHSSKAHRYMLISPSDFDVKPFLLFLLCLVCVVVVLKLFKD